MFMGILAATLLESLLSGKRVFSAVAGERTIRAEENSWLPLFL